MAPLPDGSQMGDPLSDGWEIKCLTLQGRPSKTFGLEARAAAQTTLRRPTIAMSGSGYGHPTMSRPLYTLQFAPMPPHSSE